MPKRSAHQEEKTAEMMFGPESFISPRPTQCQDLSSPPVITRRPRNIINNDTHEQFPAFIPIPSFEGIQDLPLTGENPRRKPKFFLDVRQRQPLTPLPANAHLSPIRTTRCEAPLSPPKMRVKGKNFQTKRYPSNLYLPSLRGDSTLKPSFVRGRPLRRKSTYMLDVRPRLKPTKTSNGELFPSSPPLQVSLPPRTHHLHITQLQTIESMHSSTRIPDLVHNNV